MSRIGNQPVEIPKGVSVTTQGRQVTVKGPKGELKMEHRPEVSIDVEGATLTVQNLRPERDRHARAFHGLTRSLINNMVIGVAQGYEKKLEITGVGYQAKVQGNKVVLNLGFADDRVLEIPKGIEVECSSPTAIAVRGCDKQMVGETAARIRKMRPPEPYKGKGIKYDTEIVRRKAGKAFGSA